jgi:site-specific recombinase XerD
MIPDDLAQTLQLPKIKKRIQRTPDTQEIQAIINTCDLKTLKGIRDVALVSLLTDSGLRSREIRQLPIKNVQFGVKVDGIPVNLLIVDGKGDDEEPAFFGQATAERLRAWLEVRPAAPDVDTLFVSIGGSTPGQPFTRHGLRTTLIKLGQKAGVEGTTPHAFRRSFACIADEAGASTRTIQSWGRWSDIKMVERYTLALKAGKKYNKYSPMDYIETLED